MAISIVLAVVIIKLARFWGSSPHRKSLWTGRGGGLSGESSEGTGDMRDVSPHELILSSLSVPSQGLSPSPVSELLIYLAPHV